MSAQTVEMGAGHRIGSKWWVVAAVVVALVVAILFVSAALAGDSGGNAAPSSAGGSTQTHDIGVWHEGSDPMIQVGGGPARFKVLP